jgi:hypothetical protein
MDKVQKLSNSESKLYLHKKIPAWEQSEMLRLRSRNFTWTKSVVYWSEFLATDPEVWVRFPERPYFLRSSGSGTGPLSLVRIIEELFQGNSGSGLENRD